MTGRPETPDLVWTDAGPRSGRFGDVYFSVEDGLSESRAVFLKGAGLPEAWAGRRRFTVAELGFGTGLNVLALLELWARERPPGGRLSVFSVEAFPLTVEEAERAHAAWPELAPLAEALRAQWPPAVAGFHRIDLPQLNATLDIAVLEAAGALAAWQGRADAWFLDGFSPATNPQMWRDEVLAGVAARSAPGAVAATFTVAGAVRRGLEAQGFAVSKRPGFGRKRERLEARLPGHAADPAPRRIAVIGGGIAAAALARAFRAEGADPVVIDSGAPGASGNASALVTPRLDAGAGPVAELFAQALERARALYPAKAVLAEGVLQLEQQARDGARFDKIAAQPLWRPGRIQRLDAEAASARLDEPVGRGGLWLADALVVEPAAILQAWRGHALAAEAGRLEPAGDAWRILDPDGRTIGEADAVVVASGWGAKALCPDLPLSPVRGQATVASGLSLAVPVAWGGYAAPAPGGLLFGATHDRAEASTDARAEDDRRNLESLRAVLPHLAARLEAARRQGRAAVRAVTPDRLPLGGEVAPGLFVLTGLGSRGFCLAPLLAEHLAALVTGAPTPVPAPFADLVAPSRFRR